MPIVDVLSRVARAVESVVEDLTLQPHVGPDTFFEGDADSPDDDGEWSRYLGFYVNYRGEHFRHFEHATTGSEPERVCGVALAGC